MTLSASLGELVAFLDYLPEPRIVMGRDYRIVAANRAYLDEFSSGGPLIGRTCHEVSHHFTVPCDQAGEACPLGSCQKKGTPEKVLHLHHTPHGEEHVAVEVMPIHGSDGQIRYFVETMRVLRHASGQEAARGLVGRAPSFRKMLERIQRVAASDAAVLLLGETGTGKELVAQAIHEASERRDGPFVTVDCGGLTESLFESELFGYEKGAFTGASHRKHGLVEAASGGTLFLDEVGELPLSLQVKLLRLLETATYRRVGGLETLRADFRLISATHRALGEMVEAESFRRDLYHRINTFPIRTPSLHERSSDIPLLARSLLKRVDRQKNRSISTDALVWLAGRRYRGNIRELRNLIERASLMADSGEITLADFQNEAELSPPSQPSDGEHFQLGEPVDLDVLEARYLAWLMPKVGGEVSAAARILRVSPRTLYRKLNKTVE